MKLNRLKAKLLAGEPALGCSVMIPSPQIVEMLGHAGFDWVLLDCEHGSLSLADVEIMTMAAEAVDITAIARPHSNATTDIQSVMDRGVMGVQVPHVNDAGDARRARALTYSSSVPLTCRSRWAIQEIPLRPQSPKRLLRCGRRSSRPEKFSVCRLQPTTSPAFVTKRSVVVRGHVQLARAATRGSEWELCIWPR